MKILKEIVTRIHKQRGNQMRSCKKCGSSVDALGRAVPPPQADKFTTPSLATDSIVLRSIKGTEKHDILLITRGRDPFKGHYAFPGGFVDYNEDPLVGCLRELEEECGLIGLNPMLVTVAGDPKRDPRKHVVGIAYKVDVAPDALPKAGDDAATAHFYPLQDILNNPHGMAFDHYATIKQMVLDAYPQYTLP